MPYARNSGNARSWKIRWDSPRVPGRRAYVRISRTRESSALMPRVLPAGYDVPAGYGVSISARWATLATSPASLLGEAPNQASRISVRVAAEVSRRLSARTFASFHFRAPDAVA